MVLYISENLPVIFIGRYGTVGYAEDQVRLVSALDCPLYADLLDQVIRFAYACCIHQIQSNISYRNTFGDRVPCCAGYLRHDCALLPEYCIQ